MANEISDVQSKIENELTQSLASVFGNFRDIVLSDVRLQKISEDEPLFHYTNIEAFNSIISKNEVWASSAAHTNDYNELDYGLEILQQVCEQISPKSKTGIKFLDLFRSFVREFIVQHERFIFCLSEDGDDLGQWRGYASRDGGIAIGFSPKKLRQFGELSQVVYNQADQTRVLSVSVSQLITFVDEASKSYSEDEILSVCSYSAGFIGGFLKQFKNSAFQSEREWRLVFERRDNQVHYRAKGALLIPYIASTLTDQPERLPISSLVIGPQTSHKDLLAITIQKYMIENGYDVPVEQSDVSFRDL